MKRVLLILITVFVVINLFGQKYITGNSDQGIPGSNKILKNENTNIPSYIGFKDGINVPVAEFKNWMATTFKLDYRFDFKLLKQSEDELGYTKYKYQEYFSGYPVELGIYIVHSKNGRIVSMNGLVYDKIEINLYSTMQEATALNAALNYIGAIKYMWQIPSEEQFVKITENDPDATYYPKGELVIFSKDADSKSLRLSFKFNIYSYQPLSRAWYYVDATSGEIIFKNDILCTVNAKGVAYTKYSGKQNMTTDSFLLNRFRLRETGRGNGIQTFNMLKDKNYNFAVDFIDSDNVWNQFNSNWDEAATDAHWGAEMTYDYYKTTFGRNSLDANGMLIKSYVHYDTNYNNAFWNGSVMTYGDGTTGMPYTVLDIIAHEMQHGVTGYEAGFATTEGGALNESFSDIFGTMVEWYAKPAQANWMMGDSYIPIRNLQDPNSRSDPDTYKGKFWDPAGETHKNSTPQSYCFYLLCMGGSGLNDIGNAYNVTGIGRDKASRIFWRALTQYMVSSSQYADSRNYCIQAAIDLYGNCSQEVKSTYEAWYAIGIGTYPERHLSFTSNGYFPNCFKNYKVKFQNTSDLSSSYSSYKWDFGDGSVDTNRNLTHTYANYGAFTLKFYGYSTCDTDSVIVYHYAKLDSNYTCAYTEPVSTGTTINSCHGILLDDGGLGDYTANKSVRFTISPPGASYIELRFKSFAFEDCTPTDCDYINIYDGPNTVSPLIGKYTGFNLPNGGTIRSTGSSITIQEHTDAQTNYSGFELEWFCSNPSLPPYADFTANVLNTCVGQVAFKDKSFNIPTSWTWAFGDGVISYLQNPSHTYKNTGLYSVTLFAENIHGIDTMIKKDYINVDLKSINSTPDTARCKSGSVILNASGYDNIYWYDNPNNSYLYQGPFFTTPILSTNKSFWVQGESNPYTAHAGPTDNNFGTGNYYTGNTSHFLVFDAYVDMVLISAKVYSSASGNRIIQLQNLNRDVLADTTVNIPVSLTGTRINLNLYIPKGNDLKIGVLGNNNLFYNTANAGFPYDLPGVMTIKETDVASSTPRNYFSLYDWELQVRPCKSEMKKINVSLDQTPKANFTYTKHSHDVTFKNNSTNARGYIWDFGDGNYDTVASPTHTFPFFGSFNVQLIAFSSCGSDTLKMKITLNSIYDNGLNSEVDIYPNPASQNVYIKIVSSIPDELKLKLVNTLGQPVYEKQVNNNREILEVIDVSKLPKGIYFINITDNQGTMSKKILVE